MAYFKEISVRCDKCKLKKAVVEVYNSKNSLVGKYCRTCGNMELGRLNRDEGTIERSRKYDT